MDAKIQIEIQTGYNSPWAGEFEQETISIGRAPTADVRMHPTKDTSSARDIHALVQRDSDGWKVTATHDSGVTVLSIDRASPFAASSTAIRTGSKAN
jgi:hypothetical protein